MDFINVYQHGLLPDISLGVELAVLFGCVVIGYLLGSLNSAVILSKIMYRDDIRRHGSGNAGTTNMMRTYGKKAAILTLAFDMLKAGIAVWIGILLLGENAAYVAGAACIVGHCYPLYHKFKGGKGVAVAASMCLFANPIVFLILLVFFVIIVAFTKYISLGSVIGILMLPVLLNNYYSMLGRAIPLTVLIPVLFVTVFIIWQHRSNIKRLWEGKENKFSFKKSEKTAKERLQDAQREAREDRESGKNRADRG